MVAFLAVLVYFDSYKLVSLRAVIGTILVGAAAAGASYLINVEAYGRLDLEFVTYSRYVSPLIEETIKALIIVVMIRMQRIAFLVDAAISGFAVGTGFAVVENLYYLALRPDAHLAVWIVRGFGTAIMHGGATAIFAIVSVAIAEKKPGSPRRSCRVWRRRRCCTRSSTISSSCPCCRRSAYCSRCRRSECTSSAAASVRSATGWARISTPMRVCSS